MEISISVVFNVGDWFWDTSLHKFLYHLSTQFTDVVIHKTPENVRNKKLKIIPISHEIHEKRGKKRN